MRCATCNNWLLGAEFNNVEIDYCPSCGIWLDDRELELLAGAEGKRFELNLAKSSAKTKRFCPRCNVRLSTVETIATGEKVILDQCPSRHGL
ncbi:MAG: zf-TFIIB domain-containing protein [Bacteroidetes bacterium]|nr:zf-TFIIB domain-containing protein [Bacteroidota bacterium]